MSGIGLPNGMSRDNAYIQGIADTEDQIIAKIKQHIPSLSDKDDEVINDRLTMFEVDNADLALRTCACGVRIDGYYAFIDHLIEVFGGESHYGS